jgi:REP element-mobilizing transposase RayT
MSHSFNKIWIHAIWSTKDRLPLIHPNLENNVYHFLSEQFSEQGCPVRIINGMPDHIHCLFLLNPLKLLLKLSNKSKGAHLIS